MNHFFKTSYILLLTLISAHIAVAQDGVELRNLDINPHLINARKPLSRKSATPLILPFFEDFSSLKSPYPNPDLWQDNLVFINADFPLFPPSIGVATLDALNANGKLYTHATTYSFPADTLTSRPIRLDSMFQAETRPLTIGDSIYFSFQYQPGGGFGKTWTAFRRGRAPKSSDVLILEFLNDSLEWEQVWEADGQNLDEFCPLCITDTTDYLKTFFKHVLIAIDADRFLHDQFQFRFRNLSSLDPAWQNIGGQWHIDYIYLNYYRSADDFFSNDIAFVERGQRLLTAFQAMPTKQFRPENDLVSTLPIVFRNLDNDADVVTYSTQILNGSHQVIWNATPADANVLPFYSHGFNSMSDISKPQLHYKFPDIDHPETFRIYHILKKAGEDISADNDTMVQTVHFGNFYAYDDGVAELGFGLNSANGQFAYRFPMEVSDTLSAIQIYFNHTLVDMRQAYFNLMIWPAENDSTPASEPIYIGQDITPVYRDTIGYETYVLDQPLVLPKGSFFIGFQQKTETFLNLGFDQNNNAENRMFYYNQELQEWLPVFYHGAVMMRPLFGTANPSGFGKPKVISDHIKIFPNPCYGILFVESPEMLVKRYEIYDLTGRKLLQNTCKSSQFSIQMPQHSGVYLLLLHTENGVIAKKVVRQ